MTIVYHVPFGYKLVPIDPTPKMAKAANEQRAYDERRGTFTVATNIYRAMLDAAPVGQAHAEVLTDEQIALLPIQWPSWKPRERRRLVRAVERAHGIFPASTEAEAIPQAKT